MRTPVKGARLSSKFGVRKHPILGFNKMHRGVDFAAKRGRPLHCGGSRTTTRPRRRISVPAILQPVLIKIAQIADDVFMCIELSDGVLRFLNISEDV